MPQPCNCLRALLCRLVFPQCPCNVNVLQQVRCGRFHIQIPGRPPAGEIQATNRRMKVTDVREGGLILGWRRLPHWEVENNVGRDAFPGRAAMVSKCLHTACADRPSLQRIL